MWEKGQDMAPLASSWVSIIMKVGKVQDRVGSGKNKSMKDVEGKKKIR